jgi:UDP-N-acetylmuramoyl-L-alanyl-D-glutamate--2,6-diaminopimelate ligase
MRKVIDIFKSVAIESIIGDERCLINELVFDSRLAKSGSLFFALKGTNQDGHDYIQNVLDNGCKAVVLNTAKNLPADVTQIIVNDTHNALSLAACNFFDSPSSKLRLIGITGTNGKTTTATLLYNLFSDLSFSVGLISTVVNKIGKVDVPATHTTPNPIELNSLLAEMVEQGCTYCFMEVSSHAIHQKRILGLSFFGGVFTNITHDHLDYHQTFSEYIRVKKMFFDMLPAHAFALSNSDDKNGGVMLQNTKAAKHVFALKSMAEFKGKIIQNDFDGLLLNINNQEVMTQLIGEFNASNLLAVYAVGVLCDIDKMSVLTSLSKLNAVEGRFQYVRSASGITAVIDYAHTPDALENVLETIKSFRKPTAKIITVVGCGGDRDRGKRPKMARIANDKSDQVILTSDNPRTENPNDILEEMREGLRDVQGCSALTIPDRKQAIQTAILLAQANDVILIAGKGHEKYQEINGVKYDFDDFIMASTFFNLMKK